MIQRMPYVPSSPDTKMRTGECRALRAICSASQSEEPAEERARETFKH